MITRRGFVAGAGTLALAGSARPGWAQTWPTQPVRILVGYPAGGGVDLVARLVSEPMRSVLGQPVVVENRTGAAAMLAAGAVARAAPDGHTLLMAASGEVAINHHLYKEKMAYNPEKELVPIALVGIVPCVVVVHADSPIRTPKDLVDQARANPGKLSFSSSGIGNPQQLAGELMNTMAGIQVQHIPYRGSAPAVADVATGTVSMSFSSLAAALPLMQSGKIRAVAVTSLERMPQLPDVAPLQEGAPELKGYELLNWFAMFGTAGTPAAVVERLNGIVNKTLAEPKTAAFLDKQAILRRPMDAAQFNAFVASETRKFAEIMERAKITL